MGIDIIEKTYKKLAIQVSLNGLSFCCFDTFTGNPTHFKTIRFDNFQKNIKIEELFLKVFNENLSLTEKYDEIVVIHSNNLSTFVPTALFDEEFMGSYLQYNTKVFDTDFFAFDALENYQMNNVYIPYVNMNNFFIDRFGTFNYTHSSTILVSKLLAISNNDDDKKMFVHLSKGHFEIVVVQNRKLILYNTFEYETPEDFIYYILFTAEQLQLNPENFKLELLGLIDETDEFFKIAFKYIRNCSIFVEDKKFENFNENQIREHFILLHS